MNMTTNSDELKKSLTLDELIDELRHNPENFHYQPKQLNAEELSRAAFKKLFHSSYMLENIAGAVVTVGQRADNFEQASQTMEIAEGSSVAALAVSGYAFFRIPFLYLCAYLLGLPIPFTLDNNARWLYSATLMSLAITAIVVPVAAPFIAFASAGIVSAGSCFFLGKALYARHNLLKENKQLEELNIPKAKMELIKKAKCLDEFINEKKQSGMSEESILSAIHTEQEQYNLQKEVLDRLYNKKLENTQLLEKLSPSKILDKTISVFLGAATIAGLIVSLFFPPAGLAILGGVAVVGATYVLGRLLAPYCASFGRWLANKLHPSNSENDLIEDNSNRLKPNLTMSSTLCVLNTLQRGEEKSVENIPEQPPPNEPSSVPLFKPVELKNEAERNNKEDDIKVISLP